MSFIRSIFSRKKGKTTSQFSETTPSPLAITHLLEARQSFRNGDYQRALVQCQDVLNVDPVNTDAYRLRGVTKYKLLDVTGAVEDFQHALEFVRSPVVN